MACGSHNNSTRNKSRSNFLIILSFQGKNWPEKNNVGMEFQKKLSNHHHQRHRVGLSPRSIARPKTAKMKIKRNKSWKSVLPSASRVGCEKKQLKILGTFVTPPKTKHVPLTCMGRHERKNSHFVAYESWAKKLQFQVWMLQKITKKPAKRLATIFGACGTRLKKEIHHRKNLHD